MLAQQRQDRIARTLRAEGPAAVSTLAERLGVSQATVRRDLLELERQGRLTRVYGGAVSSAEHDEPFADVATVRVPEKDAIAARAATLIADGETVLLDIGTTAHRFARRLHGRAITVVTSSLAVCDELRDDEAIELIVLGGTFRRSYRSLVGFLTEDALRQIHADRVFLGTSGVRPDGSVLDTTSIEVPVKRAMIAAADQVVLLADATKFPGRGLARVCGPEQLDVVVTDASGNAPALAALGEAGVEIQQAGRAG
ncbi:DeoR/GlpR family DNA-binding transcription regulator [Conexibacter woesei]|uniref:Lactose phosphotransferase system repressor n=1 Tax=Conexibacter woesei (strain DSM 14684 / CCUG 47730 / CIP 108061 / JCM 11494 / NBRC 100937 / ID131577) TaxID=469383 RepID=D3F8M0_CONWI|nr:DeoR/GlpR family DNA-binding transcription regulator [Conexibacter woesei]ADB50984.1 transcriptional regulator, DeoR family [Conexibacter woesei DSM 14684]